MQGLTWRKQALVRSPKSANELCLTSGIVSYRENIVAFQTYMHDKYLLSVSCTKLCFSLLYLHALEEEGHNVATSHESLNVTSKTLSQATQKIQSHNHEVLIRSLILLWVLVVHLERQARDQGVLQIKPKFYLLKCYKS